MDKPIKNKLANSLDFSHRTYIRWVKMTPSCTWLLRACVPSRWCALFCHSVLSVISCVDMRTAKPFDMLKRYHTNRAVLPRTNTLRDVMPKYDERWLHAS